MTVTTLPTAELPADTLDLAQRYGLRPEVADAVLTTANEVIRGKIVQTPEDLAYTIEAELDEADRPQADEIATDAIELLGFRVAC